MSSISGSLHRARSEAGRRTASALCAAVALAALLPACDPTHERDTLPSLVISPGSALEGASLTVQLTAPGIPLSQCQDLSGASLEFSFGGEPAPVEATTLEALDTDTLRARLLVSIAASPGDHVVVLHCDARTDVNGIFSVRERIGDPAVTLDPPAIKAGSFNSEIVITGVDIAFSEELTHVVFGDGEHITVRDQVIVDGASQMSVFVDVDPLTPSTVGSDAGTDTDAEEGPMEVAVITGDLVARGELTILPRDTPWILVEPDYIELTGTETPAQTTHYITGTSIAFVQPTSEADAGSSEETTSVAFPENPGLHVTSIVVDGADPSLMTITVLAEQSALLGPTPLTVTTGGETVSAAFDVYPPGDGAAFLTLSPAHIPRGARSTVVAHGYGTAPFTSEDPEWSDLHLD